YGYGLYDTVACGNLAVLCLSMLIEHGIFSTENDLYDLLHKPTRLDREYQIFQEFSSRFTGLI
ncbi:hypothetical protein CYY_009835, partial [Polysphondylium violaceum]